MALGYAKRSEGALSFFSLAQLLERINYYYINQQRLFNYDSSLLEQVSLVILTNLIVNYLAGQLAIYFIYSCYRAIQPLPIGYIISLYIVYYKPKLYILYIPICRNILFHISRDLHVTYARRVYVATLYQSRTINNLITQHTACILCLLHCIKVY